MRRALTTLTVASVLFLAALAFAAEKKDDAPPPPPPPPPSSKEETSPPPPPPPSDGASDSPSGNTFRQQDALLDASGGKKRPMMLSFFLGIPYYYFWSCYGYGGCGFPLGLGARFAIPILHDGFLPMLNDSFEIEGGLDANIYFGSSYPIAIGVIAAPRWTFYSIPKLAAYFALNFGLIIYAGRLYSAFDFIVNPAVGILFKLTDTLYLRAEIGAYQLKAGLGIAF